jgi:hypothetical protein
MKITKEYINQLIISEMATSRFSTPTTGEPTPSPIIDAKNKVTATIAALTMLIADSQIPIKGIEHEIARLEKLERILSRLEGKR